jgi:hypothetical protein
MSSLRSQDRKSLCRFTFADGRLCRTPRSPGHPHLCSDHARKDSQARGADKLARELSYFFSGEYLSACDLSTALGRLIAGVARGDVKPRSARTLAYLSQTLVQTIHLAQAEYINALGADRWRWAIRNSVKGNYDYRFPPGPQPESSEPHPHPAAVAHALRGEAFPSAPPPQTQQPAPSPHTPLPATTNEFVQHVMASRNTGESRAPHVVAGLARSVRPGSTGETGDSLASNNASPSATTPASLGPASTHSPARSSLPTPSSSLPTARPTTPPIQSLTGAQHPTQPQSEPQPPVAAAPSTSLQEPRPAAGQQTGPSGLPVLAPLPPRKPGAPQGSPSS